MHIDSLDYGEMLEVAWSEAEKVTNEAIIRWNETHD